MGGMVFTAKLGAVLVSRQQCALPDRRDRRGRAALLVAERHVRAVEDKRHGALVRDEPTDPEVDVNVAPLHAETSVPKFPLRRETGSVRAIAQSISTPRPCASPRRPAACERLHAVPRRACAPLPTRAAGGTPYRIDPWRTTHHATGKPAPAHACWQRHGLQLAAPTAAVRNRLGWWQCAACDMATPTRLISSLQKLKTWSCSVRTAEALAVQRRGGALDGARTSRAEERQAHERRTHFGERARELDRNPRKVDVFASRLRACQIRWAPSLPNPVGGRGRCAQAWRGLCGEACVCGIVRGAEGGREGG